MDLGWVGLGKLGAPAFLAFAAAGHTMHGYDVSKKYEGYFEHGISLNEAGFEETLASTPRERLQFEKSISDVVAKSEVVFVAVQTPHSPQYEGTTIAPEHRKDFDYAFLTQAVRDIACAALEQDKHITIAVISTALPGSFNKHLRGLKNHRVTLVYNPFFIAMGTTIADVQRPEFVLIGVDTPKDALIMQDVYSKVHDRPLQVMSIEDAELTKVSYNTFISLKIVFANMLMEICHKTGADCDRVVDALSQATDRVISPKYLRGGMGDAGACHPRDLIAMSHLAERLDLSTDLMGYLVRAREDQNRYIADLVCHYAELTGLDVVVLGRSYKPESKIETGSIALLLRDEIRDALPSDRLGKKRGVMSYDPHVSDSYCYRDRFHWPHVFVVATQHAEFAEAQFEPGSVVIDPFGYIKDQEGVTVVRVGRKN